MSESSRSKSVSLPEPQDRLQRLRAIFDHALQFIGLLSPDGIVLEANRSALEFAGIRAEDAVGRLFWQTAWWTHSTHLQERLREAVRQAAAGETVRFEVTHAAPDGQLIHVDFSLTPVRDETGTITSLVAEGRDISEYQQTEERLQQRNEMLEASMDERSAELESTVQRLWESDEQIRAIVDTAVDAIITIDEQGVIQSANPAVERMFGYSAADLVGRNISLLAPSPYREEHDGYLRRYLETGERRIIGIGREIVGERRDGSTFPIHLAVSELKLPDRRLFTGIVRDISDLKDAENRALQAERLAAIGQMITGLAHESRNAIQRAQACQEMLSLDLTAQPDLIDLVRRTRQALDDLHRLYEEVRGYAAPIKLEPELCDLAQLWRKTWDHLHVVRDEKNVRLLEETNGVDLRCRVDRHRIEQVFRNILENGLEASPVPGEIHVRCAESELGGAPALQIALCDQGPGLTTEQEKRIFDPFFSTKKKGTGLGMAIAKRLVEAHGGCIEVGNSDQPGAQIVVTLPREPT